MLHGVTSDRARSQRGDSIKANSDHKLQPKTLAEIQGVNSEDRILKQGLDKYNHTSSRGPKHRYHTPESVLWLCKPRWNDLGQSCSPKRWEMLQGVATDNAGSSGLSGIQRNTWCLEPYVGVDYNLTLQCCRSALVSIRIRIRIRNFLSTRIRIQIRGFDYQKLEKNLQLKNRSKLKRTSKL